ncbi:hypothetical protein Q31b_52760 [Novipirellula aureliae]|uniref:Uncharacterized protein n=1 Tax=Novipirellula aureliae TaxID=2527966 RepID=A0A5C6DJT4_9BACT|nr:hypothetical protein [Novipirellula aureliae]TWU35841.1 hypothetical protein Q31b_52760 [Novipirellula aureliae]
MAGIDDERMCECGWLGAQLNDPDSPVGYDSLSNSFHFTGPDRAQYSMYYCPFCGGKFPDSNKRMNVPLAPPGERIRLETMIRSVESADDATRVLGPPDYDGLMRTYRQTADGMTVDSSVTPTRNIEYYNVSDWYNIEFYFHSDEHTAKIVPKNLSATQLEGTFDFPESDDPIVGDLDDELHG